MTSEGLPLPEALVEVESPGVIIGSGYTNQQGYIQFEVQPGRYRAIVETSGYQTATSETVIVQTSQYSSIEIQLERNRVAQLWKNVDFWLMATIEGISAPGVAVGGFTGKLAAGIDGSRERAHVWDFSTGGVALTLSPQVVGATDFSTSVSKWEIDQHRFSLSSWSSKRIKLEAAGTEVKFTIFNAIPASWLACDTNDESEPTRVRSAMVPIRSGRTVCYWIDQRSGGQRAHDNVTGHNRQIGVYHGAVEMSFDWYVAMDGHLVRSLEPGYWSTVGNINYLGIRPITQSAEESVGADAPVII